MLDPAFTQTAPLSHSAASGLISHTGSKSPRCRAQQRSPAQEQQLNPYVQLQRLHILYLLARSLFSLGIGAGTSRLYV